MTKPRHHKNVHHHCSGDLWVCQCTVCGSEATICGQCLKSGCAECPNCKRLKQLIPDRNVATITTSKNKRN
jgi:hypothetical protein